MRKLLIKLFGKPIRNITIGEADEQRILREMKNIKGIYNYWLVQKQGGYQLYAKTDDRKYLGYSEMAETLIRLFDEMNIPEEEQEPDNGYESTT